MVICFVSVGAEDGAGDGCFWKFKVNQRYHPAHPRLQFPTTKLFDPEDISALMVRFLQVGLYSVDTQRLKHLYM